MSAVGERANDEGRDESRRKKKSKNESERRNGRSGRLELTTNERGYASSSDLGSAEVKYQCAGDVPHSALLFSTVLNHSTPPSGHITPRYPRQNGPGSNPSGGRHAIVSKTTVAHSAVATQRTPHHTAPNGVC